MKQRLLVVYNPRSSKNLRIQKEVIEPLRRQSGYMLGKFEVAKVPIEENIERLKKFLMDGDLVVAVGGDGTASLVLNAAMLSEKKVTIGALSFGNFNDFARMLGERDIKELIVDYERGAVRKLFPMDVLLDGQHWRYAACYMTMGMFAESTKAFENSKVRARLKKGDTGLVFSILILARWYFKNRRRKFLPGGKITDLLFVNGSTVARVMKGGDYWQKAEWFLVVSGKLERFFRLIKFMTRNMFVGISKEQKVSQYKLAFSEPEEFEIQVEGEYARVKAKEVLVEKDTRSINVVARRS